MSTRAKAIAVVAVLLALVGAFSAGRFSAPLKVETRDVEHVVFKDRVVEKVVTVTQAAKVETKIVYRDRVIEPTGRITEHEIEKTGTAENVTKTDDAVKVATQAAETEHKTETKTTLQADWRVHLQLGASLRDPLLPIAGPLVIGVQVDRRIIGGLSAGVWASTYGAAGLGVSFEF